MDCRKIPKGEVDRIEGLIRHLLRSWGDHAEFEELISLARLQFWSTMDKQGDQYWYLRYSLVRICCRQAVKRFEYALGNTLRKRTRSGPLPERVPLELLDEPIRLWETPGDRWLRVVEPDFSHEVIQRVWEEQTWTAALSLLDEEEQQTIRDWVEGGVQFGKANQHKLARCHRLLNRYRDRIGEPLRYKGGFARKKWDYAAVQPHRLTEEQRQESRERKNARYRERYARKKAEKKREETSNTAENSIKRE